MAKRIARQLSSNSEKLKKTVVQYNSDFGTELTYQDISSPQADFYKEVQLPQILNEEQIKACRSYLLYQQAVKQEAMTKADIGALLRNIRKENESLLCMVIESSMDDRFLRGRKHMLMMLKLQAEARWSRYLMSLSDFSDHPAETQIYSFMNMSEQTCILQSGSLFGESSDSSESDDSDGEWMCINTTLTLLSVIYQLSSWRNVQLIRCRVTANLWRSHVMENMCSKVN